MTPPPPLALPQKFIRFGSGILPLIFDDFGYSLENLDKGISLAVKLCPLGKECDYIELLCCTASPNWA